MISRSVLLSNNGSRSGSSNTLGDVPTGGQAGMRKKISVSPTPSAPGQIQSLEGARRDSMYEAVTLAAKARRLSLAPEDAYRMLHKDII